MKENKDHEEELKKIVKKMKDLMEEPHAIMPLSELAKYIDDEDGSDKKEE